MINFYNYFNFFFLRKKFFYNVVLKVWFNNFVKLKKILIFSVLLNSTKIDIKIFIENFIGVKVLKVNTLILKNKVNFKIKKSYVFINEFI